MKYIDFRNLAVMIAAAAVLAACATTPEPLPELEQAEAAVDAVASDSRVRKYAPVQLRDAENLLERAQTNWREGASKAELLHLAQLTRTQADIARETTELNRLEARVEELGARRDVLRLEARAARAERQAERVAAERSRAQAEAAEAEAERLAERARRARAEEAASEAERAAREEREQRMLAERRAQELEQEAERMREEADRLQEQIAELEARPTERGLVLTLGSDVLFDLDKSELREGAQRTIERIAEFLMEYEERQVLVEGFTDSTGARDYNMDLSNRRAASVRAALVERGVDETRIRTQGYGPDYPVATNETQAGRQLNRRVEVIISDDAEDVPARTE